MSDEGSDYLDRLGIKKDVIAWKQLFDQIMEELKSKNEDDESIQRFKVILEGLTSLNKKTVICWLHFFSDWYILEKKYLRS